MCICVYKASETESGISKHWKMSIKDQNYTYPFNKKNIFSSRDDMGCTEHSSTCSTEIDDPLYLRRLSQGVSRGS